MIEVPELTPRTEMTYFVHGGRVAIYYRLTLTSRASGQSVEMRVAELFSSARAASPNSTCFTRARLRWLLF